MLGKTIKNGYFDVIHRNLYSIENLSSKTCENNKVKKSHLLKCLKDIRPSPSRLDHVSQAEVKDKLTYICGKLKRQDSRILEKKLKILDKIITAAFPDINKEELFSVFTKESSIKYAGSNNSASDCHSTYSEVSYISITENNDPPITDEKSLQKEFLSELNVAVRNRASEINADTDRLIKDSSEEKSIEDNDEVEYATVNTNGMKYENFHSTDEMISNIDNIMSWLNAINQPGCEEDKRVIINLLSEDIIDIKSSLKEIDENLRNIPQDSIYEIKSELLEILEDNTEQFMRKYESSLGTYPDIKVAYENIGQILLSAEDVLIGSNKAGNSRKIINDRSYSFARYKTEKRESEKLNN